MRDFLSRAKVFLYTAIFLLISLSVIIAVSGGNIELYKARQLTGLVLIIVILVLIEVTPMKGEKQ